jgi:hypothetical protein
MAHILFTRLCREIKQDDQTGKDLLLGESDHLAWMSVGVGFVLAIYWLGYIGEEINVSTANFYAAFPCAGSYRVNIYQNGICAKTIPVHVIES